MKKVTIVALHLGYGGIEKAIVTLANNLTKKYNVEIVSTYKLFDEVPYNLKKEINIIYLMNEKPNRKEFKDALKSFNLFKATKELFKALAILYKKRKLMVKYLKKSDSDIFISTREFHNKMLSKYLDDSKIKIGWEHNHHNNKAKYINTLVKSVKNLDYFVLVSRDLYTFYNKKLSSSKVKCVYIPNMIEDVDYKLSNLDNRNLINVSRLSEEKGLFDLIDVISMIKSSNVVLNIIGDGDLKDQLIQYVKLKKLDNKIKFMGYQGSNKVHEYLSNSSLYIMTSFTESFGLVLLESFSHGVPAIAFDSAQGATELINGRNGILVSKRNKENMAEFIDRYFHNEDLKKKMSQESLKTSKEYLESNVINKWFDIID